jgi:luciferase-type oxidoreductase
MALHDTVKSTEHKFNRAYSNVFQKGKLSIGFIMPLEGYDDSPFPTMSEHQRLAKKADEAGFSALWMRDVPFYDPSFGDVGQLYDPMVYLGYLAAVTKDIALGTTGIVLPLRNPNLVAKQAASIELLSQGRFILGLSSGDRQLEYPAFDESFENRGERFREAVEIIDMLTTQSFPKRKTQYYGRYDGVLDMVPKTPNKHLPKVIVGRAQQSLEWIAQHSDGWIGHLSNFNRLESLIQSWRQHLPKSQFKPYGYGTFFELDKNPDGRMRYIGNKFVIGRKRLLDLWLTQQEQGVNHVALNLKPNRRPAEEVIDELATFVLPHFTSQGE